jgi:hypothetical protein
MENIALMFLLAFTTFLNLILFLLNETLTKRELFKDTTLQMFFLTLDAGALDEVVIRAE